MPVSSPVLIVEIMCRSVASQTNTKLDFSEWQTVSQLEARSKVTYSWPTSEALSGAVIEVSTRASRISEPSQTSPVPLSISPASLRALTSLSMASSLLWSASQVGDQKGRVVIVTGSDAGIGYETAHELAKHGAHVIVATRDEKKGTECVDRLHKIVGRFHIELHLRVAAQTRGLSSMRMSVCLVGQCAPMLLSPNAHLLHTAEQRSLRD